MQFVALDFETANTRGHSACEIGLVRCTGAELVDTLTLRIRPPTRDFRFTYLHGISWADVENQPCFADHWPAIQRFIDDADFLAAHNASFDRSVLSACCQHYDIAVSRHTFLCTVQIARQTWNIYPTKLPDVCRNLGIDLRRHHRAEDDALACARIVQSALHGMGEQAFVNAFLPKRNRVRRAYEPIRISPAQDSTVRADRSKDGVRYRERTKALADWGERKAVALLLKNGYQRVRNLNEEMPNHPFADLYAERDGVRYLIGVRTRNKHTSKGALNGTYNVCTKGRDLVSLARDYDAELSWIAVQVDAEAQSFSAYFGTLSALNVQGERYSIPMSERIVATYECLARNEFDDAITPDWTNRSPDLAAATRKNRGTPPGFP